MQNTAEGFRPSHPEQMENNSNRKGRFKRIGEKVMGFFRRELAISSPNMPSAADRLRARAAQLREQDQHRSPNAVRQRDTTADRVDLGHHNNVPSPEARFSMAEPVYTEHDTPAVVEGQVTGVEYSIPTQRNHQENIPGGIHVRQGRETYGRHDSGQTTQQTDAVGRHDESYFAPSMSGTLEPEHALHSESIGSPMWHIERELDSNESKPNEASLGSETWHAAQPKAEQVISKIDQTSTPKAEEDTLQTYRNRRSRAMNLPRSYEPGEYQPGGVIGAQQSDENSHNQKAA